MLARLSLSEIHVLLHSRSHNFNFNFQITSKNLQNCENGFGEDFFDVIFNLILFRSHNFAGTANMNF
jgi:hypothetical protein